MISPRLVLNSVIAAIVACLLWAAYSQGMEHTQTKWDADKLAHVLAIQKLKDKAATDTQTLQEKADADRKTLSSLARAADARADAYLASVQDRPDRGGGAHLPQVAGACVGQTGAALSRRDAEFLIRLAHDADRLQLALDQCQAAYESAREALKQ